jgi:nicotinamide phosphoribosyltransferase
MVGTSIPATEHSIMCLNSYGKENDEYDAFKRMITEVHPSGFVSIVSDTWNLWKVLVTTLPRLKSEIMNRDGRLVVRPDSGDPVDIICGLNTKHNDYYLQSMKEKNLEYCEQQFKGVIELLWDTFGGTINEKGYKILDPHVGCIYGDAITLERAEQICERLESKGFASSNIVLGIGSYTYNMNTRDTFGFALKTTYARQDDKDMMLFKDPFTDDGVKKSQKGMVSVFRDNKGLLQYKDGLTWQDKQHNTKEELLQCVFKDGQLIKDYTLQQIRHNVQNSQKQSIPV